MASGSIEEGNGALTENSNPFELVGDAAAAYVDVRPDYPSAAVDALLAAVGKPDVRALDLGAGTGKLTGLLLDRGIDVAALEPSADMRLALKQALPVLPSSRIIGTTAEATGLSSGAFDLLTYAQSWHWLDAELASAEAARLLEPRGVVGILYNQMDVSIPWVKRLTRIMRSGDVHRHDRPPSLGPGFTEPELTLIEWTDPLTPEQIRELGTTRSSYIKSSEANRAKMSENLRWYLFDHLGFVSGDPVEIPYTTLVWIARKR